MALTLHLSPAWMLEWEEETHLPRAHLTLTLTLTLTLMEENRLSRARVL